MSASIARVCWHHLSLFMVYPYFWSCPSREPFLWCVERLLGWPESQLHSMIENWVLALLIHCLTQTSIHLIPFFFGYYSYRKKEDYCLLLFSFTGHSKGASHLLSYPRLWFRRKLAWAIWRSVDQEFDNFQLSPRTQVLLPRKKKWWSLSSFLVFPPVLTQY